MRTVLTCDQARLLLRESGSCILLLYPDLSHIAAERLRSTAQQQYLQQEDDAEDEPDDVFASMGRVGRLLVFNV